jgi:hypothetical protein
MKKHHLPEYRGSVALIPGGTLQFLDIGLNLKAIPKSQIQFWEYHDGASGDERRWHLMCLKEEDGRYIDLARGVPATDPRPGQDGKPIQPAYATSAEKAVEPFLNQWVPLPFFRREVMAGAETPRFRNGPSNWVRARLCTWDDPEGRYTHQLTIAFDTNLEAAPEGSDEQTYPAPRERDVRDGAEFALVADVSQSAWFLAQDWVHEWLRDLHYALLRRRRPGRPIRTEEFEYQLEHLARYITFVDLLHNAGSIPSVRLIDPDRNEPIDVDLVLDIGNSRTAGMLLERRPEQGLALSNSAVLELRDLSDPLQRHTEPFGSNLAFVKMRFGDPHGHARGSGRRRAAFEWPSMVRVGPEAARVALGSRRDEGQTTMSSPKRYLWDRGARLQEWRYCPDPDEPNGEEPPVNSGLLAGFVNNQGTPLHVLEDPRAQRDPLLRDQEPYPVTEPMFSRSSLMCFLLCEILAHALVQINSPAQRAIKQNSDLARRLRTVILTVPSAMTIAERQIFERSANWAVGTLWRALGWIDEDGAHDVRFAYQAPPAVRCQWDEASTTQMVYVYNEVAEKYAGDASAYFSVFGQRRATHGERPCFRVASIDIGGGTTDLIVTTYVDKSAGAAALLEPVQEFREGFNLAGDNILKAVIERHVLAPLEAALAERGLADAATVLTSRLCRDYAGLSEQDRNLRSQFAQQYAVPMGLAILRQAEQTPLAEAATTPFTLRFADVFAGSSQPRAEVLRYLDEPIMQHGLPGFSLRDWENPVDLAEVARTIENVVTPVLRDLCEAVAAWSCDVLLLSGRPSCLPAVKAVVQKRPPLPASRIVPMNTYQVERWYPFWSPGGVIADPKTTGVVGAMLCALSEGDILNFHCTTSRLKPISTVRHVGLMQKSGQILAGDCFFSGIDLDTQADQEQEHTFDFVSPIFIGFRQLPLERWTATPFYYLSFASQSAKDTAIRHRVPYRVTLSYRRNRAGTASEEDNATFDEGVFKIEEITAADGHMVPARDLTLQLKTLKDEHGHWIDTGLFERH